MKLAAAFALVFVNGFLAAQPVDANFLVQKNVKGAGIDCEDPGFHVSFHLPLKWKVETQREWMDAGETATTITLRDGESKLDVGLYYRFFSEPQPMTQSAMDQALRVEVDKKISLRTRQGLSNYRIREEDCQSRQVRGRQALSCTAEFGGGKTESLTWIRTARCLVQFWVQGRPEQMANARARLEEVVKSLETP